ncbi:hypothetical protein ACVL92_001473 [Bradyrhizobium liaoningense]
MTKPKQGRGTRKARKTTMADYAMSFERLGQWIRELAPVVWTAPRWI